MSQQQVAVNSMLASSPIMAEMTEDEINRMAEWYAELEYGRFACESDALDKTIN